MNSRMASTSRGTKRSHSEVGDTSLHNAVRKNNLRRVDFLIKNGAEVDAKDENGRTPLHVASNINNLQIVELLTRNGAKVDAKDKNGRTPLLGTDDLEIVKLLLRAGADVNATDSNNNTLLSENAQEGNTEIVEYLINYGADLNLGFPLYQALSNYKTEVAKLLINAGADVNLMIPLKLVVELGLDEMEELTTLLIEKGANVNAHDSEREEGRAALHDAAVWNHFEFAELLIKKGADVNIRDNDGNTPLNYALFNRADKDYDQDELMQIVKLLIRNGADVNARNNAGNTALHIAAEMNDLRFATFLVEEAGADVNIANNEGKLFWSLASKEKVRWALKILHDPTSVLLHKVVGKNDLQEVKFLIKNGADVNATDKNGWVPLHIAAANGNLEILQLLIKQRAEVNAREERGRTPLHLAVSNTNVWHQQESLVAEEKYLPIVRELIKAGANVNVRDKNGRTPLFLTVNITVARELIKAGADVNVVNIYNRTTLSERAEQGRKKNVEFLIENRANLNIGDPPLSIALLAGHSEIGKLLIIAGADVNKGQPLNDLVDVRRIEDVKEIMKLMIERGVNLDATTDGKSALQEAVNRNDLEFAKLLVKYGADVNVRDSDGDTALHHAAYRHGEDEGFHGDDQFMQIVKLLIKNGANVNARNNNGETALHIAAELDDLLFATFLVEEAGADVSIANNDGNLFFTLADDPNVQRSLQMLYLRYKFSSMSRRLSRRRAGVCLKY